MRQAHAPQNVRSLGELDIVIAHDLDAIAPGVTKIQKRTVDRLDPRRPEGGARRLLVIDNEADMPAVIGGLFAPGKDTKNTRSSVTNACRSTMWRSRVSCWDGAARTPASCRVRPWRREFG